MQLADDKPSFRPVLFVLGMLLAAAAAAVGTTGAAGSPNIPAHLVTTHHPLDPSSSSSNLLLASQAQGH